MSANPIWSRSRPVSTGQYELAIAETENALALDPDQTPAYANRAFNQLLLNRLDDALLTVRLAAERKLESTSLLLTPYFVAFLKGDEDELGRTVAAVRKSPPRKTPSPTSRRSPWLAPASCRTRDGWPGRRPDRAEVWSTRTGRLVRSGHRRVGSVLWECGRREAERHQGARARKGRSRSGLCRGVRARPRR